MLFGSAGFLFMFFPLVFLLYRVLPGLKARHGLMAVFSLVFYAFGSVSAVPLLLASVACNYAAGLLLRRDKGRRAVLIAALVINLGLLGAFKYLDFFTDTINALLGTAIPSAGLMLPAGISFFTFTGISYVIEVYRDRALAEKRFVRVLLYIGFFPNLLAGPIVRWPDAAAQLDNHPCDRALTAKGLRRFVLGLAKKLLVADVLGGITDTVFSLADGTPDARLAWLGAVSYLLQIYFDFSGYSDMALGLGNLFGFRFAENFDHPYVARSMMDFWKRWHISLTTWFRQYLYIPLGGNRRGRGRTVFNRLFIFLCTGLWHGANWTFILWGLWHGALTVLEYLGVIPVKKLERSKIGRVALHGYTLLAVLLGFVLFRADSVAEAGRMLGAMFSFRAGTAENALQLRRLLTGLNITALIAAAVGSLPILSRVESRLGARAQTVGTVLAVPLFALCILAMAGSGFSPFIYFQF